MSVEIIGHAIVSADGAIADRQRRMPPELRNDNDWTRFQAALDASVLVVLGRLGHEAHPNPGRRRLVVTGAARGLEKCFLTRFPLRSGSYRTTHDAAASLCERAPPRKSPILNPDACPGLRD